MVVVFWVAVDSETASNYAHHLYQSVKLFYFLLPPFFFTTVWNELSSFGGAGAFFGTSVHGPLLGLLAVPFLVAVVSATIPLSAALRLSMYSSANLLQSRVWLTW